MSIPFHNYSKIAWIFFAVSKVTLYFRVICNLSTVQFGKNLSLSKYVATGFYRRVSLKDWAVWRLRNDSAELLSVFTRLASWTFLNVHFEGQVSIFKHLTYWVVLRNYGNDNLEKFWVLGSQINTWVASYFYHISCRKSQNLKYFYHHFWTIVVYVFSIRVIICELAIIQCTQNPLNSVRPASGVLCFGQAIDEREINWNTEPKNQRNQHFYLKFKMSENLKVFLWF